MGILITFKKQFIMKKIFFSLIVAAVMPATALVAQDEITCDVASDFVTRYIWRGQDLGNVSIQPTLGLSYKNFSLSAWGSVGIDKDDTKEFDLTAAYSIAGFNIGITDYWFNNAEESRYFSYKAHKTAHVFEANIGYDFGPVALQWYTNFAGNDGTTKAGGDKRAYSSYFEVSAPFKLGGADWSASVGAIPWKTTFYSDAAGGFCVNNVTLRADKEIKITDSFSLPIFASVTGNPSDGKAYFVAGFTLKP